MEDDVAELTQIALLGGDFDTVVVVLAHDPAPAPQVVGHRGGNCVGIAGDLGNDRPAEGTVTLGSNLQFLLNCIAFVGA